MELSNMISKEWKVVDPTTKSYCKRVADRQLVLYKEKMKVAEVDPETEKKTTLL